MDDDDEVEIVEHNILDNPCIREVFSDFSHVQIAVHDANDADKVLNNLSDLDAVIENDIQIVEHRPEHILSDLDYNEKLDSSKCPKNELETNDYLIPSKHQDSQRVLCESEVDTDDHPVHITKVSNIPEIQKQDDEEDLFSEPENDIMILPDYPDLIKERIINVRENLNAENILDVPDDYPEQIPQDYIEKDVDCRNDESQDSAQDCTDFVMIKEEVEFDGTDYTDFNEVPLEKTNDDLPPEDIYHFNNKIILGSKPCSSTLNVNIKSEREELLSEILPIDSDEEVLNADVVAEDYGSKLEENKCFCKKCDILFSTPNALDSHNMTAHSFLVAVSSNKALKSTARSAFARKSTGTLVKTTKSIARKSTGAIVRSTRSKDRKISGNDTLSKFCNHCNKVFSDHDALIQHLYELVPSKSFKCIKCDLVFGSQKDLINHNSVHIKTEKAKKKKEVLKEVKVSTKKILYEEDIKKKALSPKNFVNLIPVSVLYQCIKCNLHVLGAFAGWQHYVNCKTPGQTSKKIVVCKICKRKLRDIDMETHKKQHEICTKFKVYKVTKNLFERTLCRCPKCGVHFNELTIQVHYKRCGKMATAHCQQCNILIPKTCIYSHAKKHEKHNLRAKDFVVIQYFIRHKSNVKGKLPIPIKKIKLEKNQGKTTPKMLASKISKEFLKPSSSKKETNRMVNRLKFEKTSKVRIFFCKNCNCCCLRDSRRTTHLSKKCKSIKSVICDECGLLFNKKTIISHKRQIHGTRDLSFHDIVFNNISNMKRIVPTLPNYPQCKDCKIKFFSISVQKEHICGENYKTCKFCGDKFDNSAYNVHIEYHTLINTEAPKPKIEAKMMPELIKKYKSLTMTWSTVFSCKKCEIVTNDYDKAVEHSQDHLYKSPSLKTIKCYICNLKFDESSWSKHSELHSRMKISSKDFTILAYDPHNLLTEEWFKLFESLPEDQIRQITDKSMYGYERGIKMKLLKDGRSDLTLYSCSKCNICFHNNQIAKHIKSPCKNTGNLCKICQIPFSDINTLRYHEIRHVKGSKKEEFRVVSFLKEFRAQKRPYGKTDNTSEGEHVIYKCKNCKTCLLSKYNLTLHKCISSTRQAKCKICKELFNRSFMNKHMERHRLIPNFNSRNTTIEYFDLTKKNESDDDFAEPVKKKSKVNRKVLKPKLASKVKNKPKADTSKTNIETPKLAKVYKCDCGLHYTSITSIEKHKELCSPEIEISQENCSKCGLLFPTNVLVSHLCKHHSNNMKIVVEPYTTATEDSFESVESTSQSPTQPVISKGKGKSINKSHKVKLYKCSECNLYFVVQSTCYRHIYKDHVPIDARRCIECKLCGLQFTIKTLDFHVLRHHQEELTLDDILVEEYEPKNFKGSPKIDIYIASEKVQSRQVTSSVEESRISD